MKLITTASYYGSGSSAITDLLSEYEGIKALDSGFECRIAHDMFGLSDLEYYLSENNHRHNSSVAINMFRRLCGIYGLNKQIRMENYPLVFGETFRSSVERYLDHLIIDSFKGGAHSDIYLMSNLKILSIKLRDFIYNKFHKYKLSVDDSSWTLKGITPYERELRQCTYNITYPKESFIYYTKEFTTSLFDTFDDGKTDYLMVDQLVPPSNTMRYVRYFKNIKVFCVDRDPRDIYYNEKKFWHGGVVPIEPDLFVKWFKSTRLHRKTESDNESIVKRLYFEEIVFNYDKIISEIEDFLEISPARHNASFSKFNPDISRNNIGRWKYDNTVTKDMVILENELKDYIRY